MEKGIGGLQYGYYSNIFSYFREKQNIELPKEGKYATGMMFIDKDKGPEIKSIFESFVAKFEMKV